MKVIAINGSPNANGNTAFALEHLGQAFRKEGLAYEILHVGNRLIHGCTGCRTCFARQDGRCAINNDTVNEHLPTLREADALILAAPVYYSGIPGTMKSYLDRTFYVSGANGNYFRHKVGASLAAVRRSGGTHTFNSLNMYLTLSEMVVASSNYWNVIHGKEPREAEGDAEGLQVLDVLAANIAWLLRMREATAATLPPPATLPKVFTNFIR